MFFENYDIGVDERSSDLNEVSSTARLMPSLPGDIMAEAALQCGILTQLETPNLNQPSEADRSTLSMLGTTNSDVGSLRSVLPNHESMGQAHQEICSGCHRPITEKYMLKVMDQFWHEDCLKCSCCDCRLSEVGSTLFTKANLLLCRRDYLRLFGATGCCSACKKLIAAYEMVMKARENVYHLECFACQLCNHRFFVGDRYYLCGSKILCEKDYGENYEAIRQPSSNDFSKWRLYQLRQSSLSGLSTTSLSSPCFTNVNTTAILQESSAPSVNQVA